MIKRIELLVHAGAPSSRKDDDRYKAQAEASLKFQGRRISVSESPVQPEQSAQHLGGQSGGQQDDTTVVQSPTLFLDDTQLAITGLESQLLTSSLPIGPRGLVSRSYASQSSPEEVPSSPPDDSVDNGDARLSKAGLLAPIPSFGKRKRDDDLQEVVGPSQHDDDDQGTEDAPGWGSQEQHAASSTNPSLSSYLRTPILDRSMKKPRLEKTRDDVEHPTRLPPFNAIVNSRQEGLAYVAKRLSASTEQQAPAATAPAAVARPQHSLAVSEPTSELPTSYSLSDITSESSRARVGVTQRSASDPSMGGKAAVPSSGCADSSTVTDSSGSHPAGQQGSVRATPKVRQEAKPAPEIVVIADDTPSESALLKAAGNESTAVTVCSDPEHIEHSAEQTSVPAPVTTPSAETLQALQTLSTSIHPPEPEVSIKRFTTHITTALANLASNQDMAGRYNPVSTSRDLRSLERGHWLFDASSLALERQVKLWQFLEQAITNGGPGWGIWCERVGGADGLGVVRVWCWGEVVKHVYLLLYVGSSSQVRKLGARWVDAEGVEVVVMRRAGS